ncbi:MAG: adenosylcobinamide-GDP ribazoletransferase [Planctomycetaceae bacterium]|nr:adenosylcobinamide-GDP ribazoletransferase [Planctomycetaceae bacterium]
MILLQAVLCAVAFLTRVPVPSRSTLPPRVAGLSVAFFPVVGLLLGLFSAGAAWLLLDRLHWPPHPLWALVLVALQAFLTGALHLDGLSDVADGLGGSRGDRARALEIMKDPRIGAFGTVSLILLLMAKVLATHEVLRVPARTAALLACPMAARFGAVILVVFFPCARPTGLARTFHDESRWPMALVAAGLTTVALGLLGPDLFLPVGASLLVALGVGGWIAGRLGGLTGDAYGAAIELGEVVFLLGLAVPSVRAG